MRIISLFKVIKLFYHEYYLLALYTTPFFSANLLACFKLISFSFYKNCISCPLFHHPSLMPALNSSTGGALSGLQGPADIHSDVNDAAGRRAPPTSPTPPPITFLLF